MASLYELTVPIDQKTLEELQKDLRKPLEKLAGEYLQGHGREHAVHIFLKFREEDQEDGLGPRLRNGSVDLLSTLLLHKSNSTRLSSTDNMAFQVLCL